jgi:hypothetical protein
MIAESAAQMCKDLAMTQTEATAMWEKSFYCGTHQAELYDSNAWMQRRYFLEALASKTLVVLLVCTHWQAGKQKYQHSAHHHLIRSQLFDHDLARLVFSPARQN